MTSSHPTLGDSLEQTTDRYPDKDAIVYPRRNQILTYQAFNDRVNELANGLIALGIENGDRIATMLYNGSEILHTVYAAAKIGAVFTPMNYRSSVGELEYMVTDAEPTVLLFEAETADVVTRARPTLDSVDHYISVDENRPSFARYFDTICADGETTAPAISVSPDDTYGILYTSGTTGQPKGVVHTHRNMLTNALVTIAETDLKATDVGLSVLPMYHAGELHFCLFPRIHRGATNVIHHTFDPDRTITAIEEHEVTQLFGAPTVWNKLSSAAPALSVDLSSLRLGLYSSAPMPQQVLRECMDTLCERFVHVYGMTELGPCGTILSPEDHAEKLGSVGLPALHNEVIVVEPQSTPADVVDRGSIGEILISSPNAMVEYWNNPQQTAETFSEYNDRTWYHTGDLGYFDEDNFLYVIDRIDNMIISGGENIYPTEIEEVLYSHPEVEEAAVIGEPDDEWGERVVAYIVGSADHAELDTYVRNSDELADFKRPKAYYSLESLPKNPSGKILKTELRTGQSPD